MLVNIINTFKRIKVSKSWLRVGKRLKGIKRGYILKVRPISSPLPFIKFNCVGMDNWFSLIFLNDNDDDWFKTFNTAAIRVDYG